MLNFPLLPGDKYEGRCAEIYITEKQFLVYHCSVCEEIYITFNDLLKHITKDHYGNTKEYKEEETENIATPNRQDFNENQFMLEELIKTERNIFVGDLTHNRSELKVYKKAKNETDVHLQDYKLLNQDLPNTLAAGKNLLHRRKPRMVTSTLKAYGIGRTKFHPLTNIQLNNNDERKYICGLCGFAFKEKLNLRSHLLKHSNQKKFCCSICIKKFFTKIELRLHEYRHKGEHPYVCNHCGMGFLSTGSLTQHIKKHHTLYRPFKCEHCTKEFISSYQLKDHLLIHIKGLRIQCHKDCMETFKITNILKNDLNTQENKSEFCCENSGLEYGKKYDLIMRYKNQRICDSMDNVERTVDEGKFSLVENFDEYELVQTLTDLECTKNA